MSRFPIYDLMRDYLTLSWARFSKDVQSHTLQISKILSHPAPRPGDDGWTDYDRPLVEDLPYEWLSADTLELVCEEVCLQGQLLVLAFLDAIERRFGPDEAAAAGRKQMIGAAFTAPDFVGTENTPTFWPWVKSARTRSTCLENVRKNERYGMYSPNGTGCCLT